MQILMTQTAHDRVRDRLALIAPGAEIITVGGPDIFERAGAPITADLVQPEVVWLSLDSWLAGLLPTLIGRIMASPKTRWTQVMAAGIDEPPFPAIIQKGVRLTKNNAQAVPIAEYVLGHALSLLVPIETQAALQRERSWKKTPYREVAATRWLLVGYGNIGRAIAARIRPFGADLTVARKSGADADLASRVISQSAVISVLPEADVVVLACPITAETRGMADRAFFAAMKPGAILINIGRGDLVDDDALREALDRDQPAHAVLDVFKTEPLPADSWFWDHPKVRVTSHTSNSGRGTQARGDELFLENLRRYLAGEALLNEANRSEVGL